MDKGQLLAIIRAHRDNSLGAEDGDLSNERATALDHYHGRPYGDEKEGRSQVVSKDLSETVDWIMPAIMRVFLQSGKLAEFAPVGPEDDQLAEQASDYVHHILTQDNNAFLYLFDACWDALILKKGYLKHWWEVTDDIKDEAYSGLTEDELAAVIASLEQDGAEVEVKEQEERTEIIDDVTLPVYDVRLRIKRKHGKVHVCAVPPEEIRVSKRCTGPIQSAPFAEHVTRKTRSDLIEMGLPRDWVDELPALDEEENDQILLARDTTDDESDHIDGTTVDRSMDEIAYTEAYIRVDWDGDGIAELRKVVTVADRIPPGSEWNEPIDRIPLTDFTAKRVPHRHIGESLDDDLADLQQIMTVLKRQLLDNIYLTNNAEKIVNERVHLPDFMRTIPGGFKRVLGEEPVQGAVMESPVTPIVNQILPVIERMALDKESRTGISRSSTQIDPDVLKQSTKGAYLESLNRASQKVEMIIRTLAETGVREAVLRVYELVVKHQDKPRIIKLRGQWVPMNPAEWRERKDVRVRVGLGTGTEEEKREKLLIASTLQDKLSQLGLVGPEEAYAMFADLAKTLGFDMPEKYAMDPGGQKFQMLQMQRAQQPPPPNPLVEVEQVKGQLRIQEQQMREQAESQREFMRAQIEHMHKMHELRSRETQAALERQTKEAIAAFQGEIQALIKGMSVDAGKPGIGADLGDG